MAQDFRIHHHGFIEFPFDQRILIPYLVSLFPFNNLTEGFKYINWISLNLTVLLLTVIWMRMRIPLWLIGVGLAWLVIHPAGIGLFFNYVANTDVLSYLLMGFFILVILRRDFKWLILLAPLATLERESFVASTLIIFCCEVWNYRKTNVSGALVYVGIAVVFAAIVNTLTLHHLFMHNASSSWQTIFYLFKQRLRNPFQLLQWIDGSLVVLGGFSTLIFYIQKKDFEDIRFLTLFLLALSYFGFGLLGGGDITRIIFDGFPFIATALFYSASQKVRVPFSVIMVIVMLSLLTLGATHLFGSFIEYVNSVKSVVGELGLLLLGNLIAFLLVKRIQRSHVRDAICSG